MKLKFLFTTIALFIVVLSPLIAQDDEDEDWDLYGDLELVDDSKVKRKKIKENHFISTSTEISTTRICLYLITFSTRVLLLVPR